MTDDLLAPFVARKDADVEVSRTDPIQHEAHVLEADVSKDAPSLSICAQIARRVAYATQQNDVPVIGELVLANRSDEPFENVTLQLSCEPPVIGKRQWSVDRIAAGGEVSIRDRRITLSGGLLSELNESVRAELVLSLVGPEGVLAEERREMIALAHNEWGGSRHMPELLAAFVAPNDPAVARLLADASEVLAQNGKPRSLEGYQSKSRQRAWEIVSAIWTALVRRKLIYAEPPASFETEGQKIRTPSAVEATGLATCLDTAIMLASAIEAAGLNPIVAFTRGHAFAGVWLQPKTLPGISVEDPVEVRKAVAQDELVIFETTLVCADQPVPFSRAARDARQQIDEAREGQFVYALDVKRSRAAGIRPLAFRGDGEKVGDFEAAAIAAKGSAPFEPAPDLPPYEETPAPRDVEDLTPTERLERWKRSLLDLSKRNRLLNLRTSSSAIPLFCPDIPALEDMIARGVRLRMVAPRPRRTADGGIDPTLRLLRSGEDLDELEAREALQRHEIIANVDARTLEKGATELFRKARADLEEGGANTLFLALGILRWKPAGGKTSYRAPLILLPVKLDRASASSQPKISRHDDDPVFNLTLLEMLRQDFQIVIPGLDGELDRDSEGIDVKSIWKRVRDGIRDVPGFELIEEVALSTFSFAKYLMWKDLSDRTDALKAAPFVRHVIDTPREVYAGGASFPDPRRVDREIDPSQLFAPLNADASQIVAIHASGGSGDFVLEGPPGTGKSETIANIIAHNLALGRRVLFVSEKMAALSVVHERLKRAGLSDFCLELHSSKANKKAILDQLDASWSQREALSEGEWARRAAQLAEIRNRLNGVVEALHAAGPSGLSARDAIGRAMRYGEPAFLLGWDHDPMARGAAGDPAALDRLRRLARNLGLRFAQLEPGDVAAFRELDADEFSFRWQAQIAAAARGLSQAVRKLSACREAFAKHLALPDAGSTPDEAAAIAAIAEVVPDCAAGDLRFAFEPQAREVLERLAAGREMLNAYRDKRDTLPWRFEESRLREAPIALWRQELAKADAKMFLLASSARKRVRREILIGLGATVSDAQAERDLPLLQELQSMFRDLDDVARDLPQGTPWRGADTDAAALLRAIKGGGRVRAAFNRLVSVPGRDRDETRRLLVGALCDDRDRLEEGMPVAVAARDLAAAHAVFETALSEFRSLSGLRGREDASAADLAALDEMATAVVARAVRLRDWCEWVSVRRDAVEAGLGALVAALADGSVAPRDAEDAFVTSYAWWVAPILIDLRPELRRFSRVSHEALIEEFRKLDAELCSLSSRVIRARLSGGVPGRNATTAQDVGFNALARELQKKKGHAPVRKLVASMGDALTRLTPCLMMSPLSVAQFLPADAAAFDLVVFDEASQITVPDAIGAVARGKRVIVVGDPKQMPPTRFFERGADDDDDDDADLESILDEALAARVPHHRLTGHYRSRHETLITFSNHAYYGGQLVTYPSAETRESAVILRRVDGTYARGAARNNPAEAQAVVAEIVSRLKDPERSKLTLGVVTLNSEQQKLIEDLLDGARRADPDMERFFGSSSAAPVFVKNLETVQGDERDVILLSIGYGPTEPGAQTMPMNFGPLNRQGGERRLNVAITRATTEVVVFSSFDASMIDLTRTSALAVRHLKTYLDFAARGPVALGEAAFAKGDHDYANDFERAVADRLRALGWTIRTQVGVSKFSIDLGVVHPAAPGRFLAGVECDGATYHSAPAARDRDRVRQIVLERLGWRILRVWSTEFFHDPDATIRGVHANLEALLAEEQSRSAATAEQDAPVDTQRSEDEVPAAAPPLALAGPPPSIRDVPVEALTEGRAQSAENEDAEDEGMDVLRAASAASDLLEPRRDEAAQSARPARASHDVEEAEIVEATPVRSDAGSARPAFSPQPRPPIEPSRFREPSYASTIARLATAIVDEEGPVTLKRVSDLIARAHGFERTGQAILDTISRAVRGQRVAVRTPDGHDVLWPQGVTPDRFWSFRGFDAPAGSRDWRSLPYPEKLQLVRELMSRRPDDLARDVASVIGYGRVTESFRREIDTLRLDAQKNLDRSSAHSEA